MDGATKRREDEMTKRGYKMMKQGYKDGFSALSELCQAVANCLILEKYGFMPTGWRSTIVHLMGLEEGGTAAARQDGDQKGGLS